MADEQYLVCPYSVVEMHSGRRVEENVSYEGPGGSSIELDEYWCEECGERYFVEAYVEEPSPEAVPFFMRSPTQIPLDALSGRGLVV